jgi:hypothetical protein
VAGALGGEICDRVSIVLGSTALTVTPRPRVSAASACTNAITPAFATV